MLRNLNFDSLLALNKGTEIITQGFADDIILVVTGPDSSLCNE